MMTAEAAQPRYIVGIDLGTTNCAVAYIDTARSAEILPFSLLQLINEATVAAQPTLPSFLYLPGPRDLPEGSLSVPWDREPTFVVGQFARAQGARIPGRLVSSAKSWMCHAGVDRQAAILPWDGLSEVKKISPVEAAARYLLHLRQAWRHAMGKAYPLEEQQIILTVPASFDEVARELSVEAAGRAGLSQLTLLEEPQAALYAWVGAHTDSWQTQLKAGDVILVCDVGGGTTDLSLMTVTQGKNQLGLERIAVGEHLLLGGDNMDVALARLIEGRLNAGKRLDSQRWHLLCQLCRTAKEDLFAEALEETVRLTLPGRGSSVVGGTLSDGLTRADIEQIVLGGFFPSVEAEATPRRGGRAGLQEFGLPYETEPEILRHIAFFLRQHADEVAQTSLGLARPDAILFNGGALTPLAIRERIAQTVAAWFQSEESHGQDDWQLSVLSHSNLDLAVAHGAAYYGLVRRGQGVRIGGGSARSYYVGVGGTPRNWQAKQADASVSAVCLVRRGMEEGEEIHLTEQEFEVLANQPVSFPLYASSTRSGDQPGELLRLDSDELAFLPPIKTVLRFGKKTGVTKIPVQVSARFTEVGTLELWCEARQTGHRWRLQFQLRGEGQSVAPTSQAIVSEEQVLDETRLTNATTLLRRVFVTGKTGGEDSGPQTLPRQLEEILGTTRDSWPLSAIRALWDVLWDVQKGRAKGPEYEARWLNLIGFLLRPGFGHPTDEWRMQQVWKLYGWGITHAKATQCRAEWWNMWKRVVGGLSRQQQTVLQHEIAPRILPISSKAKNQKQSGSRKAGPQEVREMWQVAASCERLDAEAKNSMGEALVRLIEKGKASDQELWALSRLGARSLMYGPANCVVRKEKVARWVQRLLEKNWRQPEATGFALTQIARYTGDRTRDLDEALRERVAERLASFSFGQRWAQQVREVVRLEAREQARILDETLPAGLQIKNIEDEEGDTRRLS